MAHCFWIKSKNVFIHTYWKLISSDFTTCSTRHKSIYYLFSLIARTHSVPVSYFLITIFHFFPFFFRAVHFGDRCNCSRCKCRTYWIGPLCITITSCRTSTLSRTDRKGCNPWTSRTYSLLHFFVFAIQSDQIEKKRTKTKTKFVAFAGISKIRIQLWHQRSTHRWH